VKKKCCLSKLSDGYLDLYTDMELLISLILSECIGNSTIIQNRVLTEEDVP
jgi:hypothetical protein